jgi:hypothetical protein
MDAGEGVACGSEVSGCLTDKERQERMRKDDLRTGVIYMRDKGACGTDMDLAVEEMPVAV